MHKLNPRTAALLSAFGWAVGYLLAGKALAVLLPAPPGGAVFPGLPAGSAGGGRGVPGCGAAPGAAAGQGTGHSFAGGAVCLAARQHRRHGLCTGVRAGSGVAGRPHRTSLAGDAAAQCKQSAGAGDGMRGWDT